MNNHFSRGQRTRQEILETSVDLASAEGLTGLSIGRLAEQLGLSKGGLFAHFGSKEDLQLATIEEARRAFVAEVIIPIEDVENGLAKLVAMLEAWIVSVERSNYRGGCFFYAASAEMDDRPGKVRDLMVKLTGSWLHTLKKEIKLAVRTRELKNTCDVDLLSFQLHGFVQEANWFRRLHDDTGAFDRARISCIQMLEHHSTDDGKQILSDLGAKGFYRLREER